MLRADLGELVKVRFVLEAVRCQLDGDADRIGRRVQEAVDDRRKPFYRGTRSSTHRRCARS